MLDFSFLVPILISVCALLLSLYREFKGPDISLLSEPIFKVTDRSFSVSEGYVPQWLGLSEISLVFANYGGKGGTILDVKIDFTPSAGFQEFFQDFSFYGSELPITIRDGENYTMKLTPTIRTIIWKKFTLEKTLQRCVNVEEAVDKAVTEGKDKFEQFLSFLSENEELGEVSCTVSLTIGRIWPKVKDKMFFQKIKVKNEYDETIAILRKRHQNWDQLNPTKDQLISSFLNVPRNLMSEMKINLQVLENQVNENNIIESRLRTNTWDNLGRSRYHDEPIRWFLIDREMNLREDLEGIYKQILNYNSTIQGLLYLGDSRTKTDFENLNKERVKLHIQTDKTHKKLKKLLLLQ